MGIKICCLSDLHGYLPEVPDCQLLVLSGDYCPMTKPVDQQWWLRDKFGPWLTSVADRGIEVIGVAGNHDFIFQKRPDLVPKLDWTYLQDSGTSFADLKIWGKSLAADFWLVGFQRRRRRVEQKMGFDSGRNRHPPATRPASRLRRLLTLRSRPYRLSLAPDAN
jgi:hypothetical protein